MDNDICVESCPENTLTGPNYYIQNYNYTTIQNYCNTCHSDCLTCSGPKKTDCLLCKNNSLIIIDGICSSITSCPEGYFISIARYFIVNKYLDQRNCIQCPEACQTCLDSNRCLSCKLQGIYFTPSTSKSICVYTCPTGYVDKDGWCQRCTSLCIDCLPDDLS